MDGCTPAAYKEMLRLIKNFLDTKTWGLKIFPKVSAGDKLKWNLVTYSDSDWAGDKDNRRSISGFIMFLCGVPIVWRSKQQKSVALSSSEAEFVAISEAVKEVLFVIQLLESMGIEVELPVVVRVDNMGAIFMSENASSNTRTRHIDTRYHFVRELIEDKVVEIVFVKTKDNTADGFTKNVTGETYQEHSRDFVWDKLEVSHMAIDVSPAGRVLENSFNSAGTQSEASLVPSNSSVPKWTEISYHSYCRLPVSSSGLEKGVQVTPKMPDWTFLSHGAPTYVPQWSRSCFSVQTGSSVTYDWKITRFSTEILLGNQMGPG
jgi:hypothetical protein